MAPATELKGSLLQNGQSRVSTVARNKYNHGNSNTSEHQVRELSPFLESDFYEDEWKNMILNLEKTEPTQNGKGVRPFEKLVELSVLADEKFQDHHLEPTTQMSSGWNTGRSPRVDIKYMFEWKRFLDEKHARFMSVIKSLQHRDLELFRHRQLNHDNKGGCECAEIKRKTKIHKRSNGIKPFCRHFQKSYCRGGETSDFEHSGLNSHPDQQKVFLGRLSGSITPQKLVVELKKQGYNVIKHPKIIQRFSPEVCLGSVEEAQKILLKGTIKIEGCIVDVRPYRTFTEKELKLQLDINRRSVLLCGVPLNVSVRMLKAEFEKVGMKVANRPILKSRTIMKVTLASQNKAKQLVAQGLIEINGVNVNVRPSRLY